MLDFGITEKKTQQLLQRMADIGLDEADINESFVRSSGPGGQKVNKTSSCVYLKHRPTGLEVKMQKQRSQGLNRYYARKRLCELIEEEILGKQSPEAQKIEKIRKQKQRRKRKTRNKISADRESESKSEE